MQSALAIFISLLKQLVQLVNLEADHLSENHEREIAMYIYKKRKSSSFYKVLRADKPLLIGSLSEILPLV